MKKVQISLNEMEAKVYELCKSATKGSDCGCQFCFDEVAVPAAKQYGLTQEQVKGYLSSLKKKDALRKLHDSYYDFMVVELVEDECDWCFLDEMYEVEIVVEKEEAEKSASPTKSVRVYQLPIEHPAKFMRYGFVEKENIIPRLSDYSLVWEGEVDDYTELDVIYRMLNAGRMPEGFKGHSLSVSDVVEMDGKFFYCDSVGWKEVFLPEDKDEENDNPCNCETPESNASEPEPKIMKQYREFKEKHPKALLLFRCGDFYETYEDDAIESSRILGITLTYASHNVKRVERKDGAMAGFPYHALDTYLPKLIRAGKRVAICEPL